MFPKRYYEIGVTVSSLKRWSRKSVLPNLVVSNRSYEIGALVSLLKRNPNFVFLNSVVRFLHENGVPNFGDLNRCYRFFSKTVFPKTVSRNRCDRFFRETVVPQIGITEFGDLNSQNGITKSVFPFSFPKTVFRNSVIPKRCSQNGVSKSV